MWHPQMFSPPAGISGYPSSSGKETAWVDTGLPVDSFWQRPTSGTVTANLIFHNRQVTDKGRTLPPPPCPQACSTLIVKEAHIQSQPLQEPAVSLTDAFCFPDNCLSALWEVRGLVGIRSPAVWDVGGAGKGRWGEADLTKGNTDGVPPVTWPLSQEEQVRKGCLSIG